MRTGLARGELLTALELPEQTGTHGYVKLKRGASSWPIATAAAVAQDGVLTRLVLGGVAGTPVEVESEDGDDDGDRRPVGRRARTRGLPGRGGGAAGGAGTAQGDRRMRWS